MNSCSRSSCNGSQTFQIRVSIVVWLFLILDVGYIAYDLPFVLGQMYKHYYVPHVADRLFGKGR